MEFFYVIIIVMEAMMGIKEYILIGASILLIIIIIALIIVLKRRPKLKKIIKDKKDFGKLVEITYTNSGDVNGNTDFISLDVNKMKVTVEYRSNYSEPLKVKEYKVSNIDKILKMIDEYNLPAWKVLPINPSNIILDAAIKTIIFSYEKDSNPSAVGGHRSVGGLVLHLPNGDERENGRTGEIVRRDRGQSLDPSRRVGFLRRGFLRRFRRKLCRRRHPGRPGRSRESGG